MATSKIQFAVTDGNLFTSIAGEDHVSSLVFDVTSAPAGGAIPADGEIHQIFSLKQAEDLGIDGIEDPSSPTGSEYEGGVVHKHISDFFKINPNGELWLALYDCSSDWNILTSVQGASNGRVRQFGVYTPQELFEEVESLGMSSIVADIEAVADADAANNIPYSVILTASTATKSGGSSDVSLVEFPNAISNTERVSATIFQSNDDLTKAIQDQSTTKATVGCVGAFLGALSLAGVEQSIGWVSKFNLSAAIPSIAAGCGGVLTDIDNNTPYSTLTPTQLDTLDNYGYIFPTKYSDLAGTYASKDKTLTNGDYRTIARNRAIDKSRRNVRLALLPTIQQPLYVNAETGELSNGTIEQFKSIVHQQLSVMQSNGEISGFSITIDPSQDVLTNDGVQIKYRIVPVGVNSSIEIEIGLATQV